MTSIDQVRLAKLKQIVSDHLRSSIAAGQPLCSIREGLKTVTARYREFDTWGPEVHDGTTLVVSFLGRPDIVSVEAHEWCAWERGREMPLAR